MKGILVKSLSKRYKLGELKSGNTMLREAILGLFLKNRNKKEKEFIWALRDIDLSIEEGEIVGIIGRNGAGKSTLLKVLARITRPTKGSMSVNGRLASMLEVGTGFHEELTGRENIYLNGSILGMKKREINLKMDEIISFSGVMQFIDTPLKRYSSGMRLRLGFAVAAHLDPEILLVDEVLAVGDAEFQKKCLNTMGELQSGGRTVLFVSHNMAAIESLCHRVVWIDRGRIKRDGEPISVIHEYLATFASSEKGGADLKKISSRTGTGDARLTRVEFFNKKYHLKNIICSGDDLIIRLCFEVKTSISDLHVGLELHNDMGAMVTAINNWMTGPAIPVIEPGEYHMDLEIDTLNLMPGIYNVSLWLKSAGARDFDVLQHCVAMDVETSDYYGSGRGIDRRFGQIFLQGQWRNYKAIVKSKVGEI